MCVCVHDNIFQLQNLNFLNGGPRENAETQLMHAEKLAQYMSHFKRGFVNLSSLLYVVIIGQKFSFQNNINLQ